ncbi:MAG: hypothetical protein ABIF40_02130 [archaeon]
MVKIHTRQKRHVRAPPGLRKIRPLNRKRALRPKTFKTEEAAKDWAETQGIKNYELKNLKSTDSQTKKIRIEITK